MRSIASSSVTDAPNAHVDPRRPTEPEGRGRTAVGSNVMLDGGPPRCRTPWNSTKPTSNLARLVGADSFDDFVGPRQYRRWDGQTEGLGGLEIDHEFELRGLLDR